MIIDTHCHYNCEPLSLEAEFHWKNALKQNVIGGICVGTNLSNSVLALQLAEKFSTLYAAIGIHPEEYTHKIKSLLNADIYSQAEIDTVIQQDITAFTNLLETTLKQKNTKLLAIGEIGLDYYSLKTKGIKRTIVENMQKAVFSAQLELAFQHSLPVILHVRDQIERTQTNAYYDTFNILNQLVSQYKNENKKIPHFILHCASGPIDYIENCINLGGYIGFAGNVTYTNAPELREIFKITPSNRVLLETDAPYLAPNEKKGQICEPQFITETADFLQHTYEIDLDIILKNTLAVFPEFQKVVQ